MILKRKQKIDLNFSDLLDCTEWRLNQCSSGRCFKRVLSSSGQERISSTEVAVVEIYRIKKV
jgi:hypothetical protein